MFAARWSGLSELGRKKDEETEGKDGGVHT